MPDYAGATLSLQLHRLNRFRGGTILLDQDHVQPKIGSIEMSNSQRLKLEYSVRFLEEV